MKLDPLNEYPFKNNTIVCNLLDKDFFLDFYRRSNILKDITEEGKSVLPFFDYLIKDLFYILYKIVVTLKEEDEIFQEVKTHQIFVQKVLETENIRKVRRRTKGNLANSYMGLYYILQEVLDMLKDQELQKILKKQQDILDRKEDLEKQMDEEVRKQQQPEDGESRDKEEQNSSPGEVEEVLEENPASEEGAQQENLEQTSYQKDEKNEGAPTEAGEDYTLQTSGGKEKVETNQEERDWDFNMPLEAISKKIEEYEEKLKELEKDQNILLEEYRKSIEEKHIEDIENKAIFMIEDLEDKIQNLGLKTNEMKHLSFDFIINLSKTFNKPQFKILLNKIGRKRELARKGQRKKEKKFAGIQSMEKLSDDLNNIMESEYLNLGLDIEELELDFYNRYLNARLSTWQGARVEKKKKGPIIICYDGSASMEGGKIEEAKAHLFAFMEIAQKQKRKILTIQFSSAQEDLFIRELKPHSNQLQEKMDIIEGFISKGTDFEKPLEESIKYIMNHSYKDADIIFMTDGESSISKEFKEAFINSKKKHKFKMYTILIDFKKKEYQDIQELSDEVYHVQGGNWNEEISEKVFGI